MNKIDRFRGKYRFLSNFYPCVVFLHNMYCSSVEVAYQASKTVITNEQLYVVMSETPREAKRRGKKITLRKDWERVKVPIMHSLLREKFTDTHLRRLLIETEDAELIEGNEWHDTTWGCCICPKHKGQGENILGKLLMQVRQEILEGK